ncbi:mitochondrial small ribosomal subunit Rsm22-domain-containing protein [Dactylonectria macrodidyma]|uniref:Mitochondrial small ribosomal subunit Rsm22-domain-containing protein n=1 Tax=Dactylonectria macrodidyma TaxID=307937 RepID=A0A9P9JH65_9HYPO|nr:mitochondrial small ribosomal subunit Rsm22-domain-containing protein [Dactylonectria macrodidyma]
MAINIGSNAEWQSLLSGTNVVIADFYADWCGPCKMIAPHFEKLANEHSRPKKVAFVKVNVDSQSTISRAQGVSAMPTFKIFHGGNCIETIKGANPPALTQAIMNAIKLGGVGSGGDVFQNPGRKLGGEGLPRASGGAGPGALPVRARVAAVTSSSSWGFGRLLNALVVFVGLYLVSLFSFDPYKAAEKSMFNTHKPVQQKNTPKPGPGRNLSAKLIVHRFSVSNSSFARSQPVSLSRFARTNKSPAITQTFSTSRSLRQDDAAPAPAPGQSPAEVEQIVRDAKQRFRDTLPKDYLNQEEYALYERLYGPPLRETRPEDVGIDTHADMGPQPPRPDNEGTVIRELGEGEFEEISFEIPRAEGEEAGNEVAEERIDESGSEFLAHRTPGYVELVARNQREYDAMQRLAQDFQVSQKKQRDAEHKAAVKEEEEQERQAEEAMSWPEEEDYNQKELADVRRFHPFSVEGRFYDDLVELVLPRDQLVNPIRELLDRTHIEHVKKAAEVAFGGAGLPNSPATPSWNKTGPMKGVGLAADERHMTEIEADAFIAGSLPPSYASTMAILKEVRKRVGTEWLQSKLKAGGLNVLDAGSGGAGLVAWDEIIRAEWDLLKDKGEVSGSDPPGKRSVVVGSDRLRHRVKTFLNNTTFLPRLPDYEHSGEMRGVHLDAGDKPQQRKSFDVIIASHLFLEQEQDHYRQAVLNNLWSLLNKEGGVLIVVEKAHPRGFEAVAHVRDTVLKQFLQPQLGEPDNAPENPNPAYQREREPGHVIAPCTNQGVCPMYQIPGKSRGRKDFCSFNQRFVRPNFYSRVLGSGQHNQGDVDFSYVAIRRGVSKKSPLTGKDATISAFKGFEKADEMPDMGTLPRTVMRPLKRKGHVTLDLCTPEGRLERWTVPKSFSKLAYHDARKSRWGDLWALGAKTRVPREARAGRGPDDGGKRAGQGGKPRRVEITMGPGGISAGEKNAPRERRAKDRKNRKQDLIKELMEAEEEEEKIIGKQMEEEVEAELEREDRQRGRR